MSMLEKIESLINAPKKFPEQTKEWEKALDEDMKMIRKINKLQQSKGIKINAESLLYSKPGN
jgi:trehalose-6-phosphate synthase